MTENEARLIELKEYENLRNEYDKAIEKAKLGEEVDKDTLLMREKMALDKMLDAWKQVPYSEHYVNYTNHPVLLSMAQQGSK